MSQAEDLLAHARSLVRADARRPKQATLRLAVSCAYRALFLRLRHDATRKLIPGNSSQARELRRILSRCFEHGTMAHASRAFAGGGNNAWAAGAGVIPADLREVAWVFAELQEARHLADYDQLGPALRRSECVALVASSERAFAAWASVRSTTAGRAYLVALLIKPRR